MRRLATAPGPVLAAFAAAAALLAPLPGAAADSPDDERGRLWQVRTESVPRNDLKEFTRHAERGEWRAAILRLQDLLDVPPSRCSVFDVPGSRPPRFESVAATARRLFDGLPPDGRAAWEELQRRPAEDLLARGLRTRSAADLDEVRRRYPAADVRRRAHDALATLALAAGDFDRAAVELEALLPLCAGAECAPVAARLAFAQAHAGDAEGFARAVEAAKPFGAERVDGPRGPVLLSEFTARMAEIARAEAARHDGARHFVGDRTGSGRSEPPPTRLDPGWTTPTGHIPGRENEWTQQPLDGPWFHPVRPVVAQGRAVVTDGRRARALEIASGRRLWEVRGSADTLPWRDAPGQVHAPAVADGVVYAALATRSDRSGVDRNQIQHGRRIVYSLPHRVLHAIDLRSGAVLWKHDTESVEGRADAADLDRESVASPPLVVGDDVIVATWFYNTRYEVRLACFDRRTGATRWRTPLATGQLEANLFGRPVKELWTSPPVARDGRIFVTTGVGIAGAVDRLTGEVAWLSEYEQHPIPETNSWWETRDREVTLRPSGACATPVAFVAAPTDGPYVTAFSPADGRVLWRRESRSRDGRAIHWILGADGRRVFALGSRAACIDAATGLDIWTGESGGRLGPEGRTAFQPIGPGVFDGVAVWVPVPSGLAKIDAQTGLWRSEIPWPALDSRSGDGSRRTGAVATGDGALLLVSSSSVEAFYAAETLRERVEARVRERPDDAWVRLEAAEALRAALRLDDAIKHYHEGLLHVAKLPPGAREDVDRGLRSGLVQAAIARSAARRSAGDAEGALADLRTAADLASDRGEKARSMLGLAGALASAGRADEQRAVLASVARDLSDVETSVEGFDGRVAAGALARLLLAEGSASGGDFDAAARLWFEILARQPDAPLGASTAARSVRMRMESALASGGDAARRAVTGPAVRMLEQARRSGDPAAAALLSRTIPDGPFAAEAALAAAGMESAAGRPRAAAAVLEALLVASPLHGDVLARALQSLAASYRALDEVPRERSVLRRMTTDCAGAKLPDGTPAAEFAARELASPRFQDAPAATPDPRPPFRVVHETMEAAAPRPVPVLGRAPRGAEDAVLLAGEGIATLMSPDGQFRWRSLLDVEPRVVSGTREQFVFSGDDAASGRGARIAAIQAADGARLWSRRIPGQWHASHTAMGIAYVLVEDIDERGDKVTRLSAWSAETGDPLGERVLPATMSPVVAAAGDALVVYEQIRGSSGTAPRRRAIVLDAASLSPRGVVDLEQWDSSFHVAVPGRSCLVTTAQLQSVTAIDTAGGVRAWGPVTFPGAQVKSVLAAPDGVFVADTKHRIHLLSGADGSIVWTRDLAPLGQLGIYGEAAEGDVYAATVLGPAQSDQATAVTLDAATGDIRWQQQLPLEGRVSRVIPVPRALRNVVAWELPERPAEALRNRIVLFDRATGRVAATIDHSRLSKSRFMAVYTGRCIALSDPAGGTVVYAGEPPQPQGR